MEEINKLGNDKIKEMIEKIKIVKYLDRVCKKAEENYKDLKEKQDKIEDKESETYKKAEIETDKKQKVFSALSKARENRQKTLEEKIIKAKNEILTKLEEKRKFIQENKDISLDDTNTEKLKNEKEKLEKEVLLNDTSKEDFLKMSDDEKNAVRQAKENYLNNKSRINEIEDEIKTVTEMKNTLGEEKPEDALTEISNLMAKVDKYFNIEGLERLNEKRENNKEQRTMADLYNEKGEFIGTGTKRKENQRTQKEKVSEPKEEPNKPKKEEQTKPQTGKDGKNEETKQQEANSASKEKEDPSLEDAIKKAIQELRERQKLEREKKYTNEKLDSIVINEAQGEIKFSSKGKEYNFNIKKIKDHKKEIYEKYQVKQVMKDYCKYLYNVFDKARLNREMDPLIVTAIVSKYNPDKKEYVGELEEYISSIINKKPYKFDLTHNLAGLNPIQKLAKRAITRREETHGATILGKLFNKNKTLDLGRSKDSIDYRTDKIVEGAQKKMAKDVKEIKTVDNKVKKENVERFKYNVNVSKDVKESVVRTGKEFKEKEKYERGEETEVETDEKTK